MNLNRPYCETTNQIDDFLAHIQSQERNSFDMLRKSTFCSHFYLFKKVRTLFVVRTFYNIRERIIRHCSCSCSNFRAQMETLTQIYNVTEYIPSSLSPSFTPSLPSSLSPSLPPSFPLFLSLSRPLSLYPSLFSSLPPSLLPFWAAAPKGTKSCRTQGTFVRSFVRPFFCPSTPPNPRRPEICPLRPETCALRPQICPLRPEICSLQFKA